MARYFAAKSIIYRPFIYQALNCESMASFPESSKYGARTALDTALLSTIHSGLLHETLTLLLHPINSWRRYGPFFCFAR